MMTPMAQGLGTAGLVSRLAVGAPDRWGSIGRHNSMTTIYAEQLQAGDVVVDDLGRAHEVTHVDRRDGWAWPIAFDDAGWAMALGHQLVAVHRAT